MQPQMLLQRYETGKRDFSWADLQGADLSHQNLAEINLYRANLAGANLEGANLAKANLFKASLAAANLNGTNLTAANLCKVDLQGAVIESACLDEAKLRGATLPDGSAYVSPEPELKLEPEVDLPEDVAVDEQAVTDAEADLLRSQIESCELLAIAKLQKIPVLDTNEPLWCLGMVGVIAGFLCFGAVLSLYGVPLPVWLAVWASVFIAEGKPESVWVVPVTAGAIATLFGGLSLVHLILTFFLIVLTGSGILFYGRILGQRFKKTLQNGMFLLEEILQTVWLSGCHWINVRRLSEHSVRSYAVDMLKIKSQREDDGIYCRA